MDPRPAIVRLIDIFMGAEEILAPMKEELLSLRDQIVPADTNPPPTSPDDVERMARAIYTGHSGGFDAWRDGEERALYRVFGQIVLALLKGD